MDLQPADFESAASAMVQLSIKSSDSPICIGIHCSVVAADIFCPDAGAVSENRDEHCYPELSFARHGAASVC